jgi:uncharacterized Zn-binding protein involved in type VI secretion
MSAPPLFHAAKKGDRISHDAAVSTHSQSTRSASTVVAALLGQALAAKGRGGALCAQAGAGAACAGGATTLSITELLPRTSTGAVLEASPTVLVAPGIGAALAQAHPVDCKLHRDTPIAPGVSTVLVQGLPLALTGGQTACGALLCDGVPTILVGGPPAGGQGAGATGGSPITDALAYAGALADRVESVLAAVERGVDLVEQTITGTTAKVEEAVSAVSGAVSAVTGALAGITSGGVLGALAGGLLAGPPDE